MLKNKYASLFLMVLAAMPLFLFSEPSPRLSTSNFSTACGLPFFVHSDGKKYFILSREAGGSDKGTYDDFGGKRDPGENHPIISAAREFWEEAILTCVGFSLPDTQKFIDPTSGNTLFVNAFGQSVTYVVDFSRYKDAFFKNFYAARKKARGHFREKDRIAIIEWDMLKATIAQSKELAGIKIKAAILNPDDLKWYQETITLRPYFVKKMRSFFTDSSYVQGENEKIRFYGLSRRSFTHMKPTPVF